MSPTVRRLACYVALMALLGLSVFLSGQPISGLRVGAHVGIAVLQALLIFVIFMRLADAPPLIRSLAVGTTLWLLILFGLMFLDYTRR
jgi:caa(3)-type oxidase subunit IV